MVVLVLCLTKIVDLFKIKHQRLKEEVGIEDRWWLDKRQGSRKQKRFLGIYIPLPLYFKFWSTKSTVPTSPKEKNLVILENIKGEQGGQTVYFYKPYGNNFNDRNN